MQIIWRANRMGKTTEVVKIALKNDAYFVAATAHDVKRLTEQYPGLKAITWFEFLRDGKAGLNIRKAVIDDLDRCIQMLTPVNIIAASMTIENLYMNEENLLDETV